MCAQQRLQSAWTSASKLRTQCFFMQTAKTDQTGQVWTSASKLRTQCFFMWTAKTDQTGQVILFVLSCCNSYKISDSISTALHQILACLHLNYSHTGDKPFNSYIVKILKIQTPKKFAVITLKFEQGGFTIEYCIQRMQTALQTVLTLIRLSDLGLHCLPRPICPKT